MEVQHDPEIETRIAQYEMAFRMQSSVPELTDLSGESEATLDAYGPQARQPGSFAANCLLARRLAERGVRFIQLYHRGWDQHYNLPSDLRLQCQDVDQPCAALLRDLKQRGLLEDTLVMWGDRPHDGVAAGEPWGAEDQVADQAVPPTAYALTAGLEVVALSPEEWAARKPKDDDARSEAPATSGTPAPAP